MVIAPKGKIKWLYLKGISVSDVQYKEGSGEVIGGTVTWVGGDNWTSAIKNYNASKSSKSYLLNVQHIKSLLEVGYSQEGLIKLSTDLKNSPTPKKKEYQYGNSI